MGRAPSPCEMRARGRVARRRETRSDKIFELPQCGTPLDFSRGRAAFRCVSPIEGERPGP